MSIMQEYNQKDSLFFGHQQLSFIYMYFGHYFGISIYSAVLHALFSNILTV